jgi:hypothetical protein
VGSIPDEAIGFCGAGVSSASDRMSTRNLPEIKGGRPAGS